MSHQELLPLFPSALHPAIPVATQILSTLRGLTAPGRGNDLKAEERAALVGVAALLGCENKDLVQASAQKACSVSPAHFRSALAQCRRILRTVDLPEINASPPKRSSRASSSTTSPSKRAENEVEEGANAENASAIVIPSPFSTPKKKFKYSSGLDISSLVRNTPSRSKHEPAMSSPLRHSVTPSKRPASSPKEGDIDDTTTPTINVNTETNEEDSKGASELRTPSKRIKYGTRPGVDLEKVDVPPVIHSSRKKREDASAFFALRPGTTDSPISASGTGQRRSVRGIPFEDGLPEVHTPSMIRRKRPEGEKKARVKRRKDWTYREGIWGSTAEQDKVRLAKIFEALPAWLEENNRDMPVGTKSIEEVLLQRRDD